MTKFELSFTFVSLKTDSYLVGLIYDSDHFYDLT